MDGAVGCLNIFFVVTFLSYRPSIVEKQKGPFLIADQQQQQQLKVSVLCKPVETVHIPQHQLKLKSTVASTNPLGSLSNLAFWRLGFPFIDANLRLCPSWESVWKCMKNERNSDKNEKFESTFMSLNQNWNLQW